ncbi:MAG: nicotinate phosphoribosyltransferase [Dehalococcoidales bacterium]|jgi:nicotinate phosphoribosyltransferase|nr:nicotinate phosphoribosyltransferase [Dehalococcoidales bacterium]
MANVVLVSDMLRGFLEEGYPLYCGESARRIIPNIQRRLEREIAQGSTVFFLCDHHAPDDPEFSMFPPHAIEGTAEAEVIPELAKYKGEIIPKKTYSSFFGTPLEEKLKKLKPEKVIVCGVCTHICVLYAVADARIRGYEVEVPVDCVASFDEKSHRFALDYIENTLGAKLTNLVTSRARPPKFEPLADVLSGETADIYFARTLEILRKEGLNPMATMEFFTSRAGVLCGMDEVKALLARVLPKGKSEVWALAEGDTMKEREVVLRITAPYQSYGLYETAIDGILAHCSGWATAARECVEAAQGIPVVSFGARHVYPTVVGIMDYAAIVGGCVGCSSIAGAKLAGVEPSGTIPHALILVIGDTVEATKAFDKHMPAGVPRVALVDTFRDEAEESLLVAQAMGKKLTSVRLDTPQERGRVTPELVKEVRARLDMAGFKKVKIFASGGINLERIRQFIEAGAPVDAFGVGSYISGAKPIDFTADLHEIEGKPIAKRGRIPGITPNPRLKRIM